MKKSAIVGPKGQIRIPSALRKRYGISEGMTIVFREISGRLSIEPTGFEAVYALRGSLSHLPLEEDLQGNAGRRAKA